jgi:hypothetical protein
VHERGDRDPPAVVDAPDDVLDRDPRLFDEELVELGLAGDLDQRPDLDAVLLHVHQEVREAAVLGDVGVRAGEQHAPLGLVRERRPHLLAGDDVLVALAHGSSLERGQVGARLGLAEALAPHLVGAQDRREEARLLVVGAVGDHGRPAHRQPEHVGHLRGAGARDLLEEDRLLDLGRAGAAVLARPREAGPAALVELALPFAAEGEGVLVAVGLTPWVVVRDPGAQRVAELLLGR